MTRLKLRLKKTGCILAALLIVCTLSSCAGESVKGDRLSIVCTVFPEYDWVKQLIGEENDKAELTMLLDNGVDLHSYQPSVDDILKISGCDLFVYIGGESDSWVDGALKEAKNKDMRVISLMELLGDKIKEEEIVEGMQEESHDGHEAHDDHNETEYDEHVWFSLKNAAFVCEKITSALCALDPEGAELYKANCSSYTAELYALDGEYRAMAEAAARKTVLFGDRFPFRYLFDDYGLSYYAAFPGCSAETEASFETIVTLAEKTDELGLTSVLIIDGSDGRIARTIIENTKNKNQRVLMLDSMQSETANDTESKSYLSVMRKNLEVLKLALN